MLLPLQRPTGESALRDLGCRMSPCQGQSRRICVQDCFLLKSPQIGCCPLRHRGLFHALWPSQISLFHAQLAVIRRQQMSRDVHFLCLFRHLWMPADKEQITSRILGSQTDPSSTSSSTSSSALLNWGLCLSVYAQSERSESVLDVFFVFLGQEHFSESDTWIDHRPQLLKIFEPHLLRRRSLNFCHMLLLLHVLAFEPLDLLQRQSDERHLQQVAEACSFIFIFLVILSVDSRLWGESVKVHANEICLLVFWRLPDDTEAACDHGRHVPDFVFQPSQCLPQHLGTQFGRHPDVQDSPSACVPFA